MLDKLTRPVVLFRQWRRIWNVAALSEFNDLSLPLVVFDDSKRSICEVQCALCQSIHAACPANHVNEPALVAVCIGYAQRVDESVLEGCKILAKCLVEAVIEVQ